MADQQNNPYTSSVDIIRNYWKQGVLFPAYADPENTRLNYEGLDLEQNTLAMIDSDISGYRKYKRRHFNPLQHYIMTSVIYRKLLPDSQLKH